MLAMSLLRAGLDGSQMRLQHRCVGHHLATVMAVVMAVIASNGSDMFRYPLVQWFIPIAIYIKTHI